MLDTLITSKTRIKLLLKFFLNANNQAHLRGLEAEFGESSNAIRQELNRLEEAGMLDAETKGNRKLFKANRKHPLFGDIHNILMKYTGMDQIIENIVDRLGNLEAAFLVGELAKGIDGTIIDLMLVGDIDREYLNKLVEKAEKLVKKKIRYVVFDHNEFQTDRQELLAQPFITLWTKSSWNY